jgi:hypothetical protein
VVDVAAAAVGAAAVAVAVLRRSREAIESR